MLTSERACDIFVYLPFVKPAQGMIIPVAVLLKSSLKPAPKLPRFSAIQENFLPNKSAIQIQDEQRAFCALNEARYIPIGFFITITIISIELP